MPTQVSGDGPFIPDHEHYQETPHFPAHTGLCLQHPLHSAWLQTSLSPYLFPSSPWGSVPTAAVPLPGVGHRVERLLSHLWHGLLNPRLQPEPLLQAGDSAAALHGETLPSSAGSIPSGKCLGEDGAPGQ